MLFSTNCFWIDSICFEREDSCSTESSWYWSLILSQCHHKCENNNCYRSDKHSADICTNWSKLQSWFAIWLLSFTHWPGWNFTTLLQFEILWCKNIVCKTKFREVKLFSLVFRKVCSLTLFPTRDHSASMARVCQ